MAKKFLKGMIIIRTPCNVISSIVGADEHSVRTEYKAGYGKFVVESIFNGDENLGDLLYGIISKSESRF